MQKYGLKIGLIKKQKFKILKEVLEKVKEKHFLETDCNSFEIFGCDFLIDSNGRVFLLEINENPDFILSDPIKIEIYKKVFQKMFDFLKQKANFLASNSVRIESEQDLRNIYQFSCQFNQNYKF